MDVSSFDRAFPTFIRYLGAVLATVLVVAPLVSDVRIEALAGGYPLATGMILYKTVRGAAADANGGPK